MRKRKRVLRRSNWVLPRLACASRPTAVFLLCFCFSLICWMRFTSLSLLAECRRLYSINFRSHSWHAYEVWPSQCSNFTMRCMPSISIWSLHVMQKWLTSGLSAEGKTIDAMLPMGLVMFVLWLSFGYRVAAGGCGRFYFLSHET